ncbi:hypothetical protein ACFL1X_07520 [Candidatus Hydrogenedentota bacterium]
MEKIIGLLFLAFWIVSGIINATRAKKKREEQQRMLGGGREEPRTGPVEKKPWRELSVDAEQADLHSTKRPDKPSIVERADGTVEWQAPETALRKFLQQAQQKAVAQQQKGMLPADADPHVQQARRQAEKRAARRREAVKLQVFEPAEAAKAAAKPPVETKWRPGRHVAKAHPVPKASSTATFDVNSLRDTNEVRKGIILAEVLGPPKALRRK